jgi:predicted HicB family RNase H-like nuclease
MTDKTFSHKGYCGSIESSIEDDCLYGQILFVRDVVTYEAEKIGELKTAFEQAVDYYLEKCEREGLVPDKPFNGSFNVRLSPEMHRSAAMEAARVGTSLNDLVKECLESRLTGQKTVLTINQNHQHFHYPEGARAEPTQYYEEPEWQPAQVQSSQASPSRPRNPTRH